MRDYCLPALPYETACHLQDRVHKIKTKTSPTRPRPQLTRPRPNSIGLRPVLQQDQSLRPHLFTSLMPPFDPPSSQGRHATLSCFLTQLHHVWKEGASIFLPLALPNAYHFQNTTESLPIFLAEVKSASHHVLIASLHYLVKCLCVWTKIAVL